MSFFLQFQFLIIDFSKHLLQLKKQCFENDHNFNFEFFFNYSKFQFMFDHSKFFINKNKNKKRRFLLFTQFFVQNFQNENFNQIINIEFF